MGVIFWEPKEGNTSKKLRGPAMSNVADRSDKSKLRQKTRFGDVVSQDSERCNVSMDLP